MKLKLILFYLIYIVSTKPIISGNNNLNLAGRWLYGPANVVTLDSSYIYAGSGAVIEIFNRETGDGEDGCFSKNGEIKLNRSPIQIEVKDSLLFVLNNAAEFRIFNVKDKTRPFSVGKLDMEHHASKFFIKNNFVYFAADSFGLIIADLTDPEAPLIAGNYKVDGYIQGIIVKDSIAYVGLKNSGILMLNINNPAAVTEAGTFQFERDNSYYAVDFQTAENKLYVISRPSNTLISIVRCFFSILDVSDPASPIELSTLIVSGGDMYSWLKRVFVEDTLAYLLNTTDTNGDYIRIINISDSLNPLEEHSIKIKDPRDIFVKRGHAYLADGVSGLKVFDYAGTKEDTLLCRYQAGGISRGITVKDNHAFTAAGEAGLVAVDVATPQSPESVSFYAADGGINDAAVKGEYCYCRTNSGLSVADISDPSSIKEISALELDLQYVQGLGNRIYVQGDYVYITHYSKGVIIININDPQNPQFTTSLDITLNSDDVFVEDTLMYLACGAEGAKIYGIADPEHPQLLSEIAASSYVFSLFAVNNRLYLAQENKLRVFDISDIKTPQEIGMYNYPGSFTDIKVRNDYVYLADSKFGLRIINSADMDSLYETASYRTNDKACSIILQNDLIYLSDSNDGFYIFSHLVSFVKSGEEAVKPSDFSLMQNYPNPFNPQTKITFTLAYSCRTKLIVYDVLGRKVRTIINELRPAGRNEIIFNAQGLASGIYYYRLITPDYIRTKKMLKIK